MGNATSTQAWQPIHTAPRDGSPIIAGYKQAGEWFAHVARWMPEDKDSGFCAQDAGWWSFIKLTFRQEQINPTHWIPCPPTPNA